jgi:hypothetical protein
MGELEIDTDAMVDGFEKADGEDRSSAAASTPADPAPKSNKRCTLCSRWLPDHLFPSNGWRCCECRNAYDRLAKQVIRENQQEFWEEIRNDAMELKKLLRRYSESHIMYSKTQFDLGSYIKEFSATTNSSANAEGIMMWEGYFVQFAQTAKGGSYSEKEARQRWHEMLGSPWVDKDNRGPARSPRRCRVPMYDEDSIQFTHDKKQDLQSKKDTKNVFAEQDAKDRRWPLQGHEQWALNKHGEVLDFSVCGTGGKFCADCSGFAGQGTIIPDISVLKGELEEKEEATAGAENAKKGAANGDDAGGNAPEETKNGNCGSKRPGDGEPPLPKKQRWCDVDAIDAARSSDKFCLQSLTFLCAGICIRCSICCALL